MHGTLPPGRWSELPLHIKELLTGDLNRLRFMGRFSTAHVHHRENVAEHSYYVALYGYMICLHLYTTGYLREDEYGRAFANDVMAKALLHDCEESITGDMPRMFKYRHSGVRALLMQASRQEVRGIAKKLFPWETESGLGPKRVHAGIWEGVANLWESSKDRETGAVVAFADFLSVLSHMTLEIETANWTMREHYATVCEHFSEFEKSKYDFLRDLVTEAKDLLDKLFKDVNVHDTTTA